MKNNKLLQNLLLLSFSTVFSFFMLEILYRFYLFGWKSLSVKKMNSVHNIGVSGLIVPSPYSEVIYELKPHLRTYFKMAKFETNSRGLRDKEYAIAKLNNTIRIAVIGDSFTMPAGVNIEEAYHRLLEEKLNEEQRGLSYEFINFGVGGYSLRQYWGVIKYKAKEYEPDIILVGFCPSNDYNIPSEKHFQNQYKVKRQTYPFFKLFALNEMIRGIKKRLAKRDFQENQVGNQYGVSKEKQEYGRNYFSKMGIFSKENNIPIVVVFLARRPFKHSKLTEKLTIDSGLYFLDVSSSFKGKNLKDYKIYAIDNHPNGKANKIFAERIYDYLDEMSLL